MDDNEGFCTCGTKIIYFDKLEKVKQYCLEHEVTYIDEPTHFDMVQIQKWVAEGTGEDIDCDLLLNFWNIVIDLAIFRQ